jgi:GAF domain-containing protein
VNGIQICNTLNKKASNGADFRELLTEAVRLLHESNERFHWTGIYELLPGNILQLGPFVGEPTDHVVIAVGDGVCGSAVADRCNKNIPDVTKESNYLACSSATRSELVVLIERDGIIFAQVDIDSHDVDAFDAQATTDVQNVADWLAAAYQKRAQTVG